jgi:hypothetical protein
MTVQVLKLTSGETLLTDVINETSDTLTVINPLEIRTEYSNRSRMNMIAYQWLPMMEEENIMYISHNHIIGMAYASQDMQEYYIDVVQRILESEDVDEEKEKEEFMEKVKQLYTEMANTDTKSVH